MLIVDMDEIYFFCFCSLHMHGIQYALAIFTLDQRDYNQNGDYKL